MATPTPKKTVILLHGGPALSGYFGSLERELDRHFRLISYTQSGETIAELVAQLESFVRESWARDGEGPVLVGHSWGASLALFYAAAYAKKPKLLPSKIIVMASAPLDLAIKDEFSANLKRRIPAATRIEMDRLEEAHDAAATEEERDRIRKQNLDLLTPFYNAAPESTKELTPATWNYAEFQAIWEDLQPKLEKGSIPGILARITTPVVSFHGTVDPFPSEATHNFLRANLSDFRARTYMGAGHFAWVEPKGIGARFLEDLREEIAQAHANSRIPHLSEV